MLGMKSIEENLPSDRFIRVHRSFIVNPAKISVVGWSHIGFDGNIYNPVNETYIEIYQKYIEGNFV